MKKILQPLSAAFLLVLTLGVFASGCVERRYYREHHQHSPDYYYRHHRTPPPGVEIDIHN